MIFVDTSAWAARSLRNDRNHPAAVAWFAANNSPLVTSDYVIDEVLTLLQARQATPQAMVFGDHIFQNPNAICWVTPQDVSNAWQVFRRFTDKRWCKASIRTRWSFTDCVSRVVIERLEIKTALAFDEHFRQFGTVQVLP